MPRPWNLADFVLIVLGGFAGAGLALALGLALDNADAVTILGLAGQYLGHIGVLWFLSRKRAQPDLGFRFGTGDLLYMPLGVLLQLVLAVLFLPLTNLLFPEGESAQQIGETLSTLKSRPAQVAVVVIAVVLAPVVEELTFRGVLVKAMPKSRRVTIMVVTSLVFAGFHLFGLAPDAMLAAAAIVLPQLFVVGLILAYVTLKSERLGPAIFIHSGFNLLAAIALLIPADLLSQLN